MAEALPQPRLPARNGGGGNYDTGGGGRYDTGGGGSNDTNRQDTASTDGDY